MLQMLKTAGVLLQKRKTPSQKHILHVADFDNRLTSSAEEKDSRSEAHVACCNLLETGGVLL